MSGDTFTPLVPFFLGFLLRGVQLRVRGGFELQDLFDRLDVGVLIFDLRLEERLLFFRGLGLGFKQRLERQRRARSGLTLSIEKSSTEPCVRGSIVTADIRPTVVLSRALAARKNWLRNWCSGGREQPTTSRVTGTSKAPLRSS